MLLILREASNKTLKGYGRRKAFDSRYIMQSNNFWRKFFWSVSKNKAIGEKYLQRNHLKLHGYHRMPFRDTEGGKGIDKREFPQKE